MKSIFRILITLSIGISGLASPMPNNPDADPFAGRWTLNVQKSIYPQGTCPKSMVIEMEVVNEGIRYRSNTLYSNGAASTATYIAKYDNRPVLVHGSSGFLLPVSLMRIDGTTVVATYKRGMQVVATSRRQLSSDHKVMTIKTVITDKDGQSITTIGIYDKASADGLATK